MIYVIVYNALAHARSEAVPLPVDSANHYIVERLQADMGWAAVQSNLIANHNYAKTIAAAPFTLYFKARMPPLGASVFRIKNSEENIDSLPVVARSMIESKSSTTSGHLRVSQDHNSFVPQAEGDLVVSNDVLSVEFDRLVIPLIGNFDDMQSPSLTISFLIYCCHTTIQIHWCHQIYFRTTRRWCHCQPPTRVRVLQVILSRGQSQTSHYSV